MNKETIIKISISCFLVLICIVGGYSISKNVKEYKALGEERDQTVEEAKNAKKEYDEYREDVQREAHEEAEETGDEDSSKVAKHNKTYGAMNNISENFFDYFFTWEDSEEYKDRAEKAKDIATKNVTENERIFDDGKDSLGGDYIKTTGVKAEFENTEAFPVDDEHSLIAVTYSSWFDDKKTDSAMETKYYYVTFNEETNKIEDLEVKFSPDKNTL